MRLPFNPVTNLVTCLCYVFLVNFSHTIIWVFEVSNGLSDINHILLVSRHIVISYG